mgnify:CR=1 FL=1
MNTNVTNNNNHLTSADETQVKAPVTSAKGTSDSIDVAIIENPISDDSTSKISVDGSANKSVNNSDISETELSNETTDVQSTDSRVDSAVDSHADSPVDSPVASADEDLNLMIYALENDKKSKDKKAAEMTPNELLKMVTPKDTVLDSVLTKSNCKTAAKSEYSDKIQKIKDIKHNTQLGISSVETALRRKNQQFRRAQIEFDKFFDQKMGELIEKHTLHGSLIAIQKTKDSVQFVLKVRSRHFPYHWKQYKNPYTHQKVVLFEEWNFILSGHKYSLQEYYTHITRSLLNYVAPDENSVRILPKEMGLLVVNPDF